MPFFSATLTASSLIPSTSKRINYILEIGDDCFPTLLIRCEMAGLSGATFTKYDKFKRLDYVWPVTQKNKPGVENCHVYNPEILHIEPLRMTSPFVFPDFRQRIKVGSDHVTKKYRMKAFAAWNSVSDHYPVYMKFFVPQ